MLEERAVPATITVTSPFDDPVSEPAAGTLRYAIQQVNLGNFDTIEFDLPDVHTISPEIPLPAITRPVSINPSLHDVVLSGKFAGGSFTGLKLAEGSDGSAIRGLVIGDFGFGGIEVYSNHNIFESNKIGTNEVGTAAAPNGYGMLFQPGSTGNRVGGAGVGNLMSGNKYDGLRFDSTPDLGPGLNVIVGNRFGTNASGTAAIPNGDRGILLVRASGNTIGGATAGLGNLVSGNQIDGITLSYSPSNVVIGNLMGTDVTGVGAIPNGYAGISLLDDNHDSAIHTVNNRIGGGASGERNIISGNRYNGIYLGGSGTVANLIQGNWIGPNLLGKAIHGNGYHGISLDQVSGNFIGTDSAGQASDGLGNVISGNAIDGIYIGGGANNVVAGNLIGVEPSGEKAAGNGLSGIELIDYPTGTGSHGNRIGGLDPASRNVIGGNLHSGIAISGQTTTANVVQGNFIGLDRTGSKTIGNAAHGVEVHSPGNLIGTDASGNVVAGARNVIAGNQDGIMLEDADNSVIGGNFVGTDASGTIPLGNRSIGLALYSTNNVRIGSPLGLSNPSLAGVIAASEGFGVALSGSTHVLLTGYFIGTDPSASVVMGNNEGVSISDRSSDNVIGVIGPNAILFNSHAGVAIRDETSLRNTIAGNLMSNFGPSIDLGDDGVTPNHPGGPITGPNGYTNEPVLTFAANGNLGIVLNAAPSTTYRIDYYASAPTDPAFSPQAQFPLGTVIVTTDANGNASAVAPYTPIAGASVFSAAATDSSGNTSELSGPATGTPLQAVGASASLTATVAGSPIVAYLVDLDPRASADRFVVSVDWGDGTPASSGSVVPVAGGFAVVAPHAYSRPGAYSATVRATDAALGVNVTVTSTVQVAPIPIIGSGRDYTFPGRTFAFSNVVATFTDAGPALPLKSYRATVSWGDGTTSVGKITSVRGAFVVRANHRFSRFSGTRDVTVTISDTTGRRAVATDHVSFRPSAGIR